MEELVLDSGVRKIAVKNEDGEVVTVLSINVADADTADQFGKILDNLQRISDNCQKEADEWRKANPQEEADTEDVAKILEINRIRVKYLNQIMDEIDGLFGESTVRNVYGDIVPDEAALIDFVEKVIPVMNKLFGKRYEMTRKRYNSGRKGARA